jgi:hypothetical protein
VTQVKKTPPAAEPEARHEDKMIVLDLGKKSRKKIKRLRQGRGALMDRVQETIGQLREENELSDSSDIVVVIVKENRKSRGLFF